MKEYDEYLEFAKDIALYAGRVMMDNYNNSYDMDYKEDETAVTMIDKEINYYLIKRVKEKYKNHAVNGEEENYKIESDYVWVCDPLDGTGMYISHIPVFMFSLALVYKGEPIVGVCYNPNEDKMYTAIKGEGSFCNGVKISVNKLKLGDLGYRLNYESFRNNLINELDMIKENKKYFKTSSIGSVVRACMAVASGDFCCDIFPGTSHGNCDLAASKLIVEEAGGMVTDICGNKQRYDMDINGAIISNGVSHSDIVDIVRKYLK